MRFYIGLRAENEISSGLRAESEVVWRKGVRVTVSLSGKSPLGEDLRNYSINYNYHNLDFQAYKINENLVEQRKYNLNNQTSAPPCRPVNRF